MASIRRDEPWRPTRADLEAAKDGTVRDVVARGLRVLFVGINPGLYTAAIGHHFGRPGNRFWPALHASGFTDRLLTPWEERELLGLGLGITNVVARATASAAQLSDQELRAGGERLERKVRRLRPRLVAFLGLGAYRTAFGKPRATIGPQQERIGESRVWLLPNPSGLNAHFQLPELAAAFRDLRREAERP